MKAKRQRRPPVCVKLENIRSVRSYTDANLKDLHDLCMLTLLHVQYEMHARGQCSEVAMIRLSDWGQLSPSHPMRKADAA